MMHFSESAVLLLSNAAQVARNSGAIYCGTEHVLYALDDISDCGFAVRALAMVGVERQKFLREVRKYVQMAVGLRPSAIGAWDENFLTDELREAVAVARKEAQGMGCDRVAPYHLVLGILHGKAGLGWEILDACGVKLAALRKVVRQLSAVPDPVVPEMDSEDPADKAKRSRVASSVLSRDCLVFLYEHDNKPVVRYAIPNEAGVENVLCWQILPESGYRLFKLAKMSEVRRVIERAF